MPLSSVISSPKLIRRQSNLLSCLGWLECVVRHQVQGLKLQQESLTAQQGELEANFEELKQLVALQHDSEAERLQEHSGLLFSAWSDALKEELEQKLNSMAQHTKSEMHDADLEEQRPEGFAAQLSEGVTSVQAMKSDITFLQVVQNAILK